VAYLSDGQRIPEDLNPARAHHLIARAVELSRKSGATADGDNSVVCPLSRLREL